MRDEQLSEIIERYLNGDMNADERKAFELLRKENTAIDSRIIEHQQFTNLLKQYGERMELENRLNAIHQEIDVHSLAEEVLVHPSWIIRLWRNHHSKISVAASIAIFAILGTLFFTGYLKNNSTYTELRRKVEYLNRSNINLTKSITDIKTKTDKRPVTPDKYRGTGFAITSNGLIVTNYHVISDADSVYVQNAIGKSFRAKVLYYESKNDIAILKISDTAFQGLGAIPYTIKHAESDLAENVYTYGYPQDSPVYGDGRVTSSNGLNGDTIDYQISVPINPGNSGGPLLDGKGNIVGIVKAKQTQLEGVHFAIKSNYLLNTIQNIPADSLNRKLNLNTNNTLTGLTRVQQIKKLQNYVFMVKVYAKN